MKGEFHDLREIYDRVNGTYFEGRLDLPIKWVGNRVSKARRVIKLGSYHLKTGQIRINRVLDKSDVPDYFVSYVVYHEMLHHLYPPYKGNRGRRKIHHEEFKQREKQFRDYVLVKDYLVIWKKNWSKTRIKRRSRTSWWRKRLFNGFFQGFGYRSRSDGRV